MTDIKAQTALLDGKLAIITGGGTGIGAEIARVFAAHGAKIVICGRRRKPLDAMASELGAHAITCDVACQDDVKSLFAKALEITGKIDILVNNAGGPGPVASVADLDMAEFEACIQINLTGAVYCLQEASKIMQRQKSGSIINMSSLMGIEGYPMRAAYVASKFALVGITETMARELGPDNVRVNTLLPGAVSGENMNRILERRAEAEGIPSEEIERRFYTEVAAMKRWVSPVEVANAALFYASDLSSSVTGDKMKVDCGRF